MKLKLDENLGRRGSEILVARGHDVATVADQRMTSAEDVDLIHICRAEQRALITLDLDFSNPLVFPPHEFRGIAVLRLPSKPTFDSLIAVIRTLADGLDREELAGKPWSVESGRIRIYQNPADTV